MKIEKNIPIPKTKADYANEMEIGDSVFFESRGLATSFASILTRVGRKGTIGKEGDGYRVWRIS